MNPKEKKKTSNNQPKYPQAPKGMHDILPVVRPYWDRIDKVMRELADSYNFRRIETPILESAKLFERSVGEETDIVQKEMYFVKTKGADALVLRPENTAGVVRAYLQNALNRLGQPQKLFYEGPMFRHENPQAGRYRQFYQVGVEVLGGSSDPIYDAQVIVFAQRLLEELKIRDIVLHLNSIGCRVCRPIYKRQLQNYYKTHEKSLCANCQRRLKTNPLRLLDCKNESCQQFKKKVPNILDKLCSTCSHHFKAVLEYLDEIGISYTLDSQLVRGLDYYSRTVFEFFVETEGVNLGALPGGGRYDYLAESIGGRPTPAVGWACGIERLIEVMKAQGIVINKKAVKKVFIAHAGDVAKKKCLKLIEELRSADIVVIESLARESLRSQLQIADREGAALAVIVGQKEVFEESVIVRDLKSGLQETFPLHRMVDDIKKRLRAIE